MTHILAKSIMNSLKEGKEARVTIHQHPFVFRVETEGETNRLTAFTSFVMEKEKRRDIESLAAELASGLKLPAPIFPFFAAGSGWLIDCPVEKLDLTLRAQNICRRNGCLNFSDLHATSASEIRAFRFADDSFVSEMTPLLKRATC